MPKHFYLQKLPHIQLPEATYFVTYRLAGSMPQSKIVQLQEEYQAKQPRMTKEIPETKADKKPDAHFEYFKTVDLFLDKNLNEPYWLKEEQIAKIIAESLHFLACSKINLWAFCIMSNHVHAVLDIINPADDLFAIMQQHKSFTASQCNKLLQRNGQFWERETYDHIIRPGNFETIVAYVINNPVVAGFVMDWRQWKWTYVNPLISEAFM